MALRVPLSGRSRLAAQSATIAWIAIACTAIAAILGAIILAGTKTGAALALLAVIGPPAAYAAFRAPLIFPFSIFILLVPFDNVLSFSSFGTITKAVAIAAGAGVAFWLLRTRKAVAPDRALLYWSIFYVWALTSLTWAIDPMYGMAHVFTTFMLIALYGVIAIAPIERKTLDVLVNAVIISGAIAGLYGAYLFHHGVDVSTNGRLFIQNDTQVIDPNQFAAALIMPFCVALTRAIHSSKFRDLLIYGSAIIAIGGGLAVAGSRGALLAIGVAFVYLLFRSRKRLILAGMGVGGLAIALGLYGNVLSRFGNAASTGGAGRTAIWQVGIAAFFQHPIFGAGFSNFELAFDRAFLSVSQSYYTRWHRAPHDILIQIGVELGIVGIAFLLTAWWKQYRAMRIIAEGSPLYTLRLALEASVIGLFFSSLFLDALEMKYLWLAFMMVMLARNAELSSIKSTQLNAARTMGRPTS